MATAKKPLQPISADDPFTPPGFDVTCIIGRVVFGTEGEESPDIAAFRLIAKHGADGHYTFPAANGDVIHVTVETETHIEVDYNDQP